MKILLDEHLPHRLRLLLVDHDVFTTALMGWDGKRNGELLALAAGSDFDVVVTKGSGIRHQQNNATIPCGMIVLRAASNRMIDIEPLVPELQRQLSRYVPRTIVLIPDA